MTHKIETLKDMAKATNPKNLDNFLADLKGVLLSIHLLECDVESFEWKDDGKVRIEIIEKTKKPKPKDFGYQEADSFDVESGWMLESGEEKYYEELLKWERSQKKS